MLPEAAITAYTVAARHRVASAAPAASSRRPPGGLRDARTHASTATRQTATTGGLIQKTARQPAVVTMKPPSSGPAGSASDDTAAHTPSARACAARSG